MEGLSLRLKFTLEELSLHLKCSLEAYCPKVVVRVTPPRACAHGSFMSMLMRLS